MQPVGLVSLLRETPKLLEMWALRFFFFFNLVSLKFILMKTFQAKVFILFLKASHGELVWSRKKALNGEVSSV